MGRRLGWVTPEVPSILCHAGILGFNPPCLQPPAQVTGTGSEVPPAEGTAVQSLRRGMGAWCRVTPRRGPGTKPASARERKTHPRFDRGQGNAEGTPAAGAGEEGGAGTGVWHVCQHRRKEEEEEEGCFLPPSSAQPHPSGASEGSPRPAPTPGSPERKGLPQQGGAQGSPGWWALDGSHRSRGWSWEPAVPGQQTRLLPAPKPP